MLGTFIPVGIPIQQDDIALEDDELYGLSIRSLHPRIIAGGGGFFAAANATIIDDDGKSGVDRYHHIWNICFIVSLIKM